MQAIVTKYLPPTNTHGARIKAECQAGSITIPLRYDLSTEDRHLNAASALCDKLKWQGELKSGWLPNGNGVFVFI